MYQVTGNLTVNKNNNIYQAFEKPNKDTSQNIKMKITKNAVQTPRQVYQNTNKATNQP